MVYGLEEGKFQPLRVLKLNLDMKLSFFDSKVLQLALASMKNLIDLCLDKPYINLNLLEFIPNMSSLRHLKLKFYTQCKEITLYG